MNMFREDNSKEIYEFNKLGDALAYGMRCELMDVFGDVSGQKGIHLYSSLAYMYMNGYISNLVISRIHTDLLLGSAMDETLESVVAKVSNDIFKELLEKYHFKNLEELVEQLNNVIIPKWYFYIGRQIASKCYANPFICGENLYYIAEDNHKKMFVKLNIKKINDEIDLDEDDDKEILGYGYNFIHGFDEKRKRVYLGIDNQNDFYHYYDISTDSFVICPHRFLFINEGNPFVVTRDNYLAYMSGENLHKIKEYHEYETFTIFDGYLLVTPVSTMQKVFLPYFITFEGEVMPATYEVCKEYIWRELRMLASSPADTYLPMFIRRRKKYNIVTPETLTMDSIMKAFNDGIPGSDRCRNNRLIILESIFGILGNYIESDSDITKLLYVLFDINRQLNNYTEEFPTRELYRSFINLDNLEKKELKKILKSNDYEDLVSLLTKNEVNNNKKSMDKTGKIGAFRWVYNKLETYIVDKKSGVVVGGQIILNMNFADVNAVNYNGIISYDCINDMYYVTSDRMISQSDRLKIVEDYNLPCEKVTYVVQSIK